MYCFYIKKMCTFCRLPK